MPRSAAECNPAANVNPRSTSALRLPTSIPMKLALKLLGVLLLLVFATPVLFAMWLQTYVSPEYLVKVTEENCNCRAQLDSSSLSLFSWPPSLRLNGIKIAPRDEHAGKPLAQRPPLVDAPVQIELAYAELLSNDILDGRITPNLIRFAGVEVRETLDPQTGSSLEKLFQPADLASAPVVADGMSKQGDQSAAVVAAEPLPAAVSPASSSAPVSTPPPAASRKPERIPLREIRLEKAHIHITNKAVSTQLEADIRDLDLTLDRIDVDPAEIGAHNHIHAALKAKVQVHGLAEIGGGMKPVQFADVRIHGEGDVTPLEPQSLLWKPAALLTLVFEAGSTLGGHMTLGDAAGNEMSKLLDHGIDLRGVRLGGILAEEARASVSYDRETLLFREPARIVLPDFAFTVGQGGWINTVKDQQMMPLRLVFGPKVREAIVQGINGKGMPDFLTRGILSLISDEQGNPSIDITLTGPLSRPEPQHELLGKIKKLGGGALESLISNPQEAKDLLNGLKSLFKKK